MSTAVWKPFIRIGLRYAAAALVAKGVLSPATGAELGSDPEVAAAVEIAIGMLIALVSEIWHVIDVRRQRAGQ